MEKRARKGELNRAMTRPLCLCRLRPAAINYYKNGKIYYRKKCEICTKHGGVAKGFPRWYTDGYRQKLVCDKCGFKSKYKEQFNVYHVDNDCNNTRSTNLKTVCANCQRVLHKEGQHWKQGDLLPDF